eukprot:scaffold79105_cov81-Phaeocystis_antarctica.AAC.1
MWRGASTPVSGLEAAVVCSGGSGRGRSTKARSTSFAADSLASSRRWGPDAHDRCRLISSGVCAVVHGVKAGSKANAVNRVSQTSARAAAPAAPRCASGILFVAAFDACVARISANPTCLAAFLPISCAACALSRRPWPHCAARR